MGDVIQGNFGPDEPLLPPTWAGFVEPEPLTLEKLNETLQRVQDESRRPYVEPGNPLTPADLGDAWPTWTEALDQMHKVLDDTVELSGRSPGFRYCPELPARDVELYEDGRFIPPPG